MRIRTLCASLAIAGLAIALVGRFVFSHEDDVAPTEERAFESDTRIVAVTAISEEASTTPAVAPSIKPTPNAEAAHSEEAASEHAPLEFGQRLRDLSQLTPTQRAHFERNPPERGTLIVRGHQDQFGAIRLYRRGPDSLVPIVDPTEREAELVDRMLFHIAEQSSILYEVAAAFEDELDLELVFVNEHQARAYERALDERDAERSWITVESLGDHLVLPSDYSGYWRMDEIMQSLQDVKSELGLTSYGGTFFRIPE